MSEKKPERTLDLHVDIDAPLEAAWKALTEGPGPGQLVRPHRGGLRTRSRRASVKNGWSEEMMMTRDGGRLGAAEARALARRERLDGPGHRRSPCDYFLSTANGKTRVRLVQSGFGASEGWDDLFDGIETGWTYFLQNLRIYLETPLRAACAA